MKGAVACRRTRGFTMLELMMAMAIFTMLGAMVIFLMRKGLEIFAVGTAESSLQDRAETILPRLVRDLEGLALPASFDPPPPRLTEDEMLAGMEVEPLPPVDVRVRATRLQLRDVPPGPLKGIAAIYIAWVVDVSEDRSDPWFRRAGSRSGPDQKELEPDTLDQANIDTAFKASGGLKEVCYVAVAENPRSPAVMTVYQGWRSPVGGPDTLLDPANLDRLEKIHKRLRPVASGVLHLEARWRRVFAKDWRLTTGRVGEWDPYVGAIWDSTRALDPHFPLFKDPESLGDPSDDLFPAWVRLEVTLTAPSSLGLERGETTLEAGISKSDTKLLVQSALPFVGPGPAERWLKIDGEWMRTFIERVDVTGRKVSVQRGQRSTIAAPHEEGSEIFIGLGARRVVRLLYHDHYAKKESRR